MLSKLLGKISKWKKGAFPGIPAESLANAQQPLPSPDIPLIPTWAPGDTILNRYRVEQVMSGSMGNVYISEHLGWKIKVAIKAPRPEVLADREGMRRILKEANSWVRMGMHPNVASCFYVLGIKKIPHLFIEFVDGGNLSDWIKAGRCRNLRTALSLGIQFCHGMEFTHQRGIIHRDIKPQNILITKNSLLKITDFGILLAHGETETGDGLTPGADTTDHEATIGFRGTPGYASPEQLRNAHTVDLRTDVFSFGLCLWVMLCGKKPFINNAVKHKIPNPTPATPDIKFSAALKEVLRKSVAYNPDDRYQNFAEVREALNGAYTAAFNTACPYAELTNIDLRADSLNNRAVSLFELGESREAAACLSKTLDVNEMLPEAVYNMILLNWRSGTSPAKIVRQIETAKKRGATTPWLTEMEAAVKHSMVADNVEVEKQHFPEFRLCTPKNSLEIFREGQLHFSVQRNILDHLENKRYGPCHDILMTAWKNNSYKKDKIFNMVYHRLLLVGKKTKVLGVQRFLTLKGDEGPTKHLAHIPNTKKFVAAGPEGKLILHDLGASSQQGIVLTQGGSAISALAICPLGKYLAVGTHDGSVCLFSTKTGTMESTERAHKGPVYALAFNDNGRQLASGGADGMMKIRKLSTGPKMTTSIKEGGAVRSITFTTTGLNLVTGSENGSVRLWDANGKECTRIIEAHAMPVISLTNSPDGLRFVSASTDRHLKVWEHTTGRCLKSIKAHDETISSSLFLQDNQTVISGCEDDIIKLWDSNTAECLAILDGRGDGIYSLAHGPKTHTFLSGRKDGAIVFWMVIYQLHFE
ncbi:MAG: protein kinase [Desulfurivibrio sp.]|nr:protein kinase [Desulfurivibrio sp.]